MSSQPLIVTVTLDEASHAWFDRLRTRYFPPDRLVVGAHVTLFHALPGRLAGSVTAMLREVAAREAAFELQVTGVRFLGRGVAFGLAARQAAAIRARFAAAFQGDLSPQDRGGWSSHLTIQNKVTPAEARRTEAALISLSPPCVTAVGLAVWSYMDGPWSLIEARGFEARGFEARDFEAPGFEAPGFERAS